jgi:hypothetical protein
MSPFTIRRLTQALGLGTVAFGVLPFVSPRRFAALAGFAPPDHPTDDAVYRSVGARDIALGIGILTAASGSPGPTKLAQIAPWVLARLLCDAGDTAALTVAICRGERGTRLLGLTGLAVIATGYSVALLGLIRRSRE